MTLSPIKKNHSYFHYHNCCKCFAFTCITNMKLMQLFPTLDLIVSTVIKKHILLYHTSLKVFLITVFHYICFPLHFTLLKD